MGFQLLWQRNKGIIRLLLFPGVKQTSFRVDLDKILPYFYPKN